MNGIISGSQKVLRESVLEVTETCMTNMKTQSKSKIRSSGYKKQIYALYSVTDFSWTHFSCTAY